MRTIEEFERAGAAAVLLEDQIEPRDALLVIL